MSRLPAIGPEAGIIANSRLQKNQQSAGDTLGRRVAYALAQLADTPGGVVPGLVELRAKQPA
jgi:hypothetical protein